MIDSLRKRDLEAVQDLLSLCAERMAGLKEKVERLEDQLKEANDGR